MSPDLPPRSSVVLFLNVLHEICLVEQKGIRSPRKGQKVGGEYNLFESLEITEKGDKSIVYAG